MKKKFLSLFLVAALSVSMFAGCGKGEEKKEEMLQRKRNKTEYVSKNGNTMVLTLFQNPKTLDIQKQMQIILFRFRFMIVLSM